jgi:Ca-activated chloride channel homolog
MEPRYSPAFLFCPASLVALLVAAVLVPMLAATAPTGESKASTAEARVMVVLDASGSMWAQIAGKTKIEIAREALAELLRGWDPKTEVGLMAYGHRRKGDCADIEVLAPAGPVDAPRLTALVNAIRPNGMTPLSEAVRQAAQSLKFSERRSTVILISDGVETCKADPCEVGAELEKLGVDFTVHVIGFDVQRQDEGGLRCLANSTGGRYFGAGDGAALREALRAAKIEVSAPAPPPRPEPAPATAPPPNASLSAPETVVAGTALEVGWTGPGGEDDYIGFAKPGEKSTGGNWIRTTAGNPVPMRAPERPGVYDLLYMQSNPGRPLARRGIEVTPARATLEAVETITAGRTVEVIWTGPDGANDYVTVVKPELSNRDFGAYAYTAKGNPARIRVPDKAGTYELRYVTGKEHEILARRTVIALVAETSLEAPETASAGSRVAVSWSGPNNQGDYITIVSPEAGDREYKGYFYTATTAPANASLELPIQAGKYEIRYVTGQTHQVLARRPIVVQAVTATLEAPASGSAGSNVSIGWTGPNLRNDFITVVPPDAGNGVYTKYFYTERTGPEAGRLVLPIKAGNYELRYVTGQGKQVLARRAITVLPITASVEAPDSAPAGTTIKVRWTGPNYQGDYVTIVEAGSPKAAHQSYFYTDRTKPEDGSLKLPAKAGSYEIRYVAAQDHEILATRQIRLTGGP